MKIWTLIENTSRSPDLTAEHGLSLYIQTGNRKLLFDMGQGAAFAQNARKLGINLSEVDTAIVSHGHYDHGGGMGTFLRENTHAPIYVNQKAFAPHFNAQAHYIGLEPALETHPRLIPTGDLHTLGDGLTLYGTIPCPVPIQSFGLTRQEGNGKVPDSFCHEQYLLAEEAGKRILFSGCSHRGILNILRRFQPDILVGGLHLQKLPSDSPELREIAQQLAAFPTRYYTGHCTGPEQFDAMKQILGDRLQSIPTGTVLEF